MFSASIFILESVIDTLILIEVKENVDEILMHGYNEDTVKKRKI